MRIGILEADGGGELGTIFARLDIQWYSLRAQRVRAPAPCEAAPEIEELEEEIAEPRRK